MKIILENEEALDMIHSALCNGGLSELASCDVEFALSDEDYQKAKEELKAKKKAEGNNSTICLEDVWAQVLRSGKPLTFHDHNEGEDKTFTLAQAIENLSKDSAAKTLLTYKNEEDDAYTAFDLLQHCLYGEIIYG